MRLKYKLGAYVASVLFLLMSSASFAAAVTYDFTLSFDSGGLAGQDFDGQFVIDDDAIGAGFVSFGPDEVTPGLLISWDITIDGTSFNETDDVDFPGFPRVDFVDGVFDAFDVIIELMDPGLLLIIGGSEVELTNIVTGDQSLGLVSSVAIRPVPLPAGGLLLLSALGFGSFWRKQR